MHKLHFELVHPGYRLKQGGLAPFQMVIDQFIARRTPQCGHRIENIVKNSRFILNCFPKPLDMGKLILYKRIVHARQRNVPPVTWALDIQVGKSYKAITHHFYKVFASLPIKTDM